MTLEDAVVLLLAAAAVISLFLGLAQALEGRGPRPPRRGQRPAAQSAVTPLRAAPERDHQPSAAAPAESPGDQSRSAVAAPAAPSSDALAPEIAQDDRGASRPDATSTPPVEDEQRAASPSTAEVASRIEEDEPVRSRAGAELPAPLATAEPAVVQSSARLPSPTAESAAAPSGPESLTADDASVEDAVADSARLVLTGRGLEALELLARHVPETEHEPESIDSFVPTALWTVLGMALVQAGALPDARNAFETAARLAAVAPANEACPAPLAELATKVAEQLLEHTGPEPASGHALVEPDLALDVTRLAIAWLRNRLASAPDDDTATALLEAARDAGSQAHGRATIRLIEERDFAGACRYVQHAAELGELSADRAQALLERVALLLRSDVDRLTAAAIRGSKDEARAITGLGQAETLLGSIPEGPVALPHRSAMARRIWLAYSKLGFRRLGAGELDSAADALFRALTMKGVGRQRQVRDAVVRALEAMGDQRVAAVSALLAQGDRAGAARVVAGVEAAIERARAEGIPAEELEVATAKLQQLAGRLDSEAAPR